MDNGKLGDQSMPRQYLVTERAHLMCPNMHFALQAEIMGAYHRESVLAALEKEAAAHPFLRSFISSEVETDRLFYDIQDTFCVAFEEITDDRAYPEIMGAISKTDWNPFESGLMRVYAFPKANNTQLLFVVHHLLCDGRGLMKFVSEFAQLYTGKAQPVYAEERLIGSMEDLPVGSDLGFVSKTLIKIANKKWRKERKRVTYEQYAASARRYGSAHMVCYEERTICGEAFDQMLASCHAAGVSVNDWLCAMICEENDVHKLIVAADIRPALSGYHEGALGNYATAFSIAPKCKGSTAQRAKEIHRLVSQAMSDNAKKMLILSYYLAMEPTLLDAAAISALGDFDSKAGRLVGAGMFSFHKPQSHSITNLGRITSDALLSAMFIPPASPAAIATYGVLSVNGVMRVCCSRNQI